MFTLDLQLQPYDRDLTLENPNFLAKSLKNKTWNKITLEQTITFKTGKIMISNKRYKMTCNLLAFDVITASSLWFHDLAISMRYGKNDIYERKFKIQVVQSSKFVKHFREIVNLHRKKKDD